MHAYQFQQEVSDSHRVTIELPANSPVGTAQIIVLFPDPAEPAAPPASRFANMAEFARWLQTQPPTGRTEEEVEQHLREERDSWE
jgi:hypothetical protein